MDRPNIVFVPTDDQRWDAGGFASDGAVRSPGKGKLPARGMHFTRAYGEVPPLFAWITERTKVIHTLGSETEKQPSFIEIYDLQNDPDEAENLASSPEFAEAHGEALSAFKQHDLKPGHHQRKTGKAD